MNKIQKLIVTLVCLLTVVVGHAANYKITALSKVGDGTVALKTSSDADITVGTTEIAENEKVKIVVAPNSGFYLDNIVLKHVVDLGQAETRVVGPSVVGKTVISRNTDYAVHFGGTYEFYMPTNHVEIEVTFTACTDIEPVISSIALDGTTYNGSTHSIVVNTGSLIEGKDFSVAWTYPTGFSDVKNVGTYRASITGIGIYKGSKTSDNLTISAKAITVTANSMSKTYRDSDPTFTYSASGLIGSDGFTGALTRDSGEDVSTYNITQGTLSAGANYSISFTGATFTILARNVTSSASITLDHESFDYDDSEHKALVSSITDKNGSVAIGTDDYSVSYGTAGEYHETADYIASDIYSMTITFKRNYSGSKTVYYQIKKCINPVVGWSTYCESEVNMAVPEGITAYTVTSCSNTAVVIESRSYIKKGVPMIINRASGTDNLYATLVKPSDTNLNGIASVADFKCADTDINVSTLANPIWILVDEYFVRSKSGTLSQGKCYLALSTPSAARLFMSRGTTAIDDSLKDIVEDSHWYTLDGRRLQEPPTRKGIYIVNGKKVVIK